MDVADNGRQAQHSYNLSSHGEFPTLTDGRSLLGKGKRKNLDDVSPQNSEVDDDNIGPSQSQASVSNAETKTKVDNVDPLPHRGSAPKYHDSRSPHKRGQSCQTNARKSFQHHHNRWEAKRSSANYTSPPSSISPRKSSQPRYEPGESERSPASYHPGTNKKSPTSGDKRWRPLHEREEGNSSSSRASVDECFDICFPDAQKYNASRWSGRAKNWEILRPGMVLLKNYISLTKQVEIVKSCQELGCGPGGFYRPGYKDGGKLRLNMMCLGLDWNAETRKYGKIREHDNAVPPEIPQEFTSLVEKALDDCHALINEDSNTIKAEDVLPKMSPDVCIVNFYNTNGRLGLHQDRDESKWSLNKGLPVVSVSIGDSAEFMYGDERDVDKAKRVLLESGDVLVFGGKSRHVFHGVTTIQRNTAPRSLLEDTNLRPGRLNLTFRKY